MAKPEPKQPPADATQRRHTGGVVAHPRRSADAFVHALRLAGIGAAWGGHESLALPIAPGWLAHQNDCQALSDAGAVVRPHVVLEDPPDLQAGLAQGS